KWPRSQRRYGREPRGRPPCSRPAPTSPTPKVTQPPPAVCSSMRPRSSKQPDSLSTPPAAKPHKPVGTKSPASGTSSLVAGGPYWSEQIAAYRALGAAPPAAGCCAQHGESASGEHNPTTITSNPLRFPSLGVRVAKGAECKLPA